MIWKKWWFWLIVVLVILLIVSFLPLWEDCLTSGLVGYAKETNFWSKLIWCGF